MGADAAGAALLVAGAAVVAFIHLRHLGLWALVLLAPALALAPVALAIGHLAPGLLVFLPLAWLFALTLLLILADDWIVRILDGELPRRAVGRAFAAQWKPLLASIAVGAVALFVLFARDGDIAAGGLAAAQVAAAVLASGLAAFAAFLPYSESFITRSNRMRARAQLAFDILIAVARPRWGFAVAGTATVIAVLVDFAMPPLVIAPQLRPLGLVVLAPVAAAMVLVTIATVRDWRAVLATLLSITLAAAAGFWATALTGQILGAAAVAAFAFVFAAGTTVQLASGARLGARGREGDDATVAAARTLVRMGPGLFFAALAGAGGLCLYAATQGPSALALALMAGFAGAGALLFQPAFAIVIETVFPRAAAIAARYRPD